MNICKKLLLPVLMLGLAGVAQAKGTGKGRASQPVIRGEVVSVATNGTSIVVRTSKKNGGKETTVQTDAITRVAIDGVPGKSVNDLESGEHVVVKPAAGVATSIKAHHKKHKKPA